MNRCGMDFFLSIFYRPCSALEPCTWLGWFLATHGWDACLIRLVVKKHTNSQPWFEGWRLHAIRIVLILLLQQRRGPHVYLSPFSLMTTSTYALSNNHGSRHIHQHACKSHIPYNDRPYPEKRPCNVTFRASQSHLRLITFIYVKTVHAPPTGWITLLYLSRNKQEPMQPVMNSRSPALNHVSRQLEHVQLQHVVPRTTTINNQWQTSD